MTMITCQKVTKLFSDTYGHLDYSAHVFSHLVHEMKGEKNVKLKKGLYNFTEPIAIFAINIFGPIQNF